MLKQRTLAIGFAIVMVASMVAPAIALGGGLATANTDGPSGMVALGDAQVSEDIPEGADPPVRADDLEGAVYASENASTLEVIVTTPDRADEYLENANVVANDEIALVARDDEHHSGRQLGVDADVLEEALGFQPDLARGVHSSGEKWNSPISYDAGVAVFDVERFSSNSVTFSGGITINAADATDGSTFTYDVGSSDGVDDFNIDLTGRETTSDEAKTGVLSAGDGFDVVAGGTTAPRDATIEIEGVRDETAQSASGLSDGDAISVDGNVDPTGESVTIHGSGSLSDESRTGLSDGSSIDVGGNVDPSGESVTIEGTEISDPFTASGSGDGSISIGGNQPAEGVSVEFEGSTDSSSGSDSGSASPGDSDGLAVGGNLDPTGEDITINPSRSVSETPPSPIRDTDQTATIIQENFGERETHEFKNVNPGGPLTGAEFEVEQMGSNLGADVYLIDGEPGTGSGTLVKSDWDPDTEGASFECDNPITADSEYVTLRVVTTEDTDESMEGIQREEVDGTTWWINDAGSELERAVDWDLKSEGYSEVSVSADDGGSATFSDIQSSETQSIDLSDSSTSLSFDAAEPEGSIDWSASWTERTATEDPSIDLDGDGSADASHAGILTEGQTATDTAADGSLSSGSNSVTTTSIGPAPSWTISGDEITATEDPSVEIDGSTYSHTGILTEGETASGSVDLSTGSHIVDVSSTGDVGGVTAEWTEDHRAHDPSADIDGSTVFHSGPLGGGETASGSVDLSTGSHVVDVSSTGSIDGVDLDWTEVEQTEDPSVSIGDDTISHTGLLDPGETVSEPISLETDGELVEMTSGEHETDVRVDWTEVSETVDPVVLVNDEATSYDGTLGDGETTSLTTVDSMIQEGENTVEIQLGDPNGGPEPQVGMEYSHDAEAVSTDVDYAAETWSERYNISHTFPDQQADASLTLPFDSQSVVSIRDLETRWNGGEWTALEETDYSLDNTTLEAEFGDVEGGDTVEVRATGSKVRTFDGEIEVREPTVEGDVLDSEIEVVDVVEDGLFGVEVSDTAEADRIHYASESSFDEAAYAEVTASGQQTLRAPEANAGSTMTVSTVPMSVAPESGAIEAVVEDGSEPRFSLREGETIGASNVEVAFYDTIPGERYVLWSVTEDREVDADRASSPVFFSTDGSSETYLIEQRDAPSSGGGGGAPAESSSGLALTLILPAVAISVGGLWWAGRRFGGARGIRGNSILLVGSSIIAVVAAELVTGRSLTSDLMFALGDGLASGAGASIFALAILLGMWALDRRTEADVPRWIQAFAGVTVFLFTAEAIRPGSVLGPLEGALVEVGAALVIISLVGIIAVWWRRSSTPDTEVTVAGTEDD